MAFDALEDAENVPSIATRRQYSPIARSRVEKELTRIDRRVVLRMASSKLREVARERLADRQGSRPRNRYADEDILDLYSGKVAIRDNEILIYTHVELPILREELAGNTVVTRARRAVVKGPASN